MPAMPHSADRAWRILPLEIAAALQPHLPAIASEMAREIQCSVPEYARSRDSTYARTVLMGAERTLRDFVELVTEGGAPGEPIVEVFRRLGRNEARCDRSLDTLQTAMHVGAEVIWRRVSQSCLRHGMTDEQLCRLAEALLAHFKENATAAAEGYVEAQTRLATEVQRRQRRLLELLLSDPPVSSAAIEEVARAANWALPETVSVVVLHDRGGDDFGALDLPDGVLVDFSRSAPCLVMPEPTKAGRTALLDRALRGFMAAIGPPLPLIDAAKSLRCARQAIGLWERGIIDGDAAIHCAEHMSTLVISQNEELIDALTTLRLAPLADLPPGRRDRLAETLLAWLQTGGDAGAVAAHLYVHPQTVRYRVRQLQELFGDRLREPDARLELELALRARRLRNTAIRR